MINLQLFTGDRKRIRFADDSFVDDASSLEFTPTTVGADELEADAVTTAKILDANVTTAKIEDLAVTTGKINNLAVTAGKLAADAVETAKIKDVNVTTGKIALLAVTTATIDNLAVTAGKLAADAVETAKIKDANVTTVKIADANVTPAKLSEILFQRTATITSAAAGTPVNILLTADVPATKKVYLQGFIARVNGATAWGTTATVKIQDNNGTPVDFVTMPVSVLTNAARVFPSTTNVVCEDAFAAGTGGTAQKGLQLVGDVTVQEVI